MGGGHCNSETRCFSPVFCVFELLLQPVPRFENKLPHAFQRQAIYHADLATALALLERKPSRVWYRHHKLTPVWYALAAPPQRLAVALWIAVVAARFDLEVAAEICATYAIGCPEVSAEPVSLFLLVFFSGGVGRLAAFYLATSESDLCDATYTIGVFLAGRSGAIDGGADTGSAQGNVSWSWTAAVRASAGV